MVLSRKERPQPLSGRPNLKKLRACWRLQSSLHRSGRRLALAAGTDGQNETQSKKACGRFHIGLSVNL